MRSLTALTFCVWMKSNDNRKEGALLSYAVPGNDNELLLERPGNIILVVGNTFRYKHFLAIQMEYWFLTVDSLSF